MEILDEILEQIYTFFNLDLVHFQKVLKKEINLDSDI